MSDHNSDNAGANQNIFGESPSANDTTPDAVSQLVGEGKKFSDIEALAKGKMESDAFIERLKAEAEEMRAEIANRPTKEEILDMVRATQGESGNTNAGLDEDAVRKLIETSVPTAVEQASEAKTRKANLDASIQKMVAKHGESASQAIVTKAQELGVTVDYLKDMASKSPALFDKTMGLADASPKPASNATPQGSVNTEAQGSQGVQAGAPGTWSYFENLRKSDPKTYFSAKVQNEIFRQRKEKGEGFYNS